METTKIYLIGYEFTNSDCPTCGQPEFGIIGIVFDEMKAKETIKIVETYLSKMGKVRATYIEIPVIPTWNLGEFLKSL